MQSAFYSNYTSEAKNKKLSTFITVIYADLNVESMFDNGLSLCVLDSLTGYDVG
jgi:hypothetical protein